MRGDQDFKDSGGLVGPFAPAAQKSSGLKVVGLLSLGQTQEVFLGREEDLRVGNASLEVAKGATGVLGLLKGGPF